MPETYSINVSIAETDITSMLATMDWLRTEFTTKITNATGDRDSFSIRITIADASYSDMKDSLAALEAQFTSNMAWNFSVLP